MNWSGWAAVRNLAEYITGVSPGAGLPDALAQEPVDGEAWFADRPSCFADGCGAPNLAFPRHLHCDVCRALGGRTHLRRDLRARKRAI